jgi:hypothetical protein
VDTIRARRLDTVAFLLAEQGNCLRIRAEELRRVTGRRLRPVTGSTLPSLPLPKSWALAVILCPGDGTEAVAAWARGIDAASRRDRLWFYEAPGVRPRDAYAAWIAADLDPNVLRDSFTDFYDFNRLFSNDLNEQIWLDHKPVR